MKVSVLFLLVSFIISCGNKTQKKDLEKVFGETEINFEEEIIDFGEIKAGEIVIKNFVFTNSGKHPLLIEAINSDCGCLKFLYKKVAVKPGETGNIEVEFNSDGLWGKQYKTIEFDANCKEPKHLAIFANVKNKDIEFKY